jgi:hypothetical protein
MQCAVARKSVKRAGEEEVVEVEEKVVVGHAVKDMPEYKPYIEMMAAGTVDRDTVMKKMRIKVRRHAS